MFDSFQIIVKALASRALSTRCPVQGSSASTSRPEKRVSSISLDSDLKSRFLYAEQMFSAAFENSFAERWTTWPFFSYSLASVVIQFSILFHSESGFGCLGGIYVSTVPVCAWAKKKCIYFVGFLNNSSTHLFIVSYLICFVSGAVVAQAVSGWLGCLWHLQCCPWDTRANGWNLLRVCLVSLPFAVVAAEEQTGCKHTWGVCIWGE